MLSGKSKLKRSSSVKQTNSSNKKNVDAEKKKFGSVTQNPPAPTSNRSLSQKTTALAHSKPKANINPAKPGVTKSTKEDLVKGPVVGASEKFSLPAPHILGTSNNVKKESDLKISADVPVVEDLERSDDMLVSQSLITQSTRQHSVKLSGKNMMGAERTLREGGLVDAAGFGGNGGCKGGGVNSSEGVGISKNVGTIHRGFIPLTDRFTMAKEEEDEEEGEEEEDEEEDEDEDEGEEEEEDEEDEGGEEEEEDDDEDDEDETAVKGERREEERITVKVSREGDRNVKVIYITQSTKFTAFAKDIMRRFGYTRLSDFDMYCIDASGDHVDIDVPQDFRHLIKEFLRTLRLESERSASPKTTRASQLSERTRRFSARGTLRGSASLSRANCSSDGVISPSTEVDRSSSTVLRLYVRDSYRTRQKEEQRGMHSASMPTLYQRLHMPRETPTLFGAKNVGSLMSGETPLDPMGGDTSDVLSCAGSTLSFPLNHTVRSLAMTIGFREDEEVQWSRMGLLGKGSFGSVYEGITSEGKIVAVKVLDIPTSENVEELKGVQREINLMRSLKHKNIVAYYGCQSRALENGMLQLEIFLEHCHGGSLSHLRRKFERAKERFSISLIRTYTRQILEGLNYLHSMNVVHRDLKSDNVLISALGEAKLADFGCSKRLGTATMEQRGLDERGPGYQTTVGTPLFMAPEVLSCDGSYTKAADVWSVGCLLLEMLGRQPWTFTSDTNAFRIMYHISKSTTMPTGVPKQCPASLHSFFTRCFEHDPQKRATAGELLTHEWITCSDSKLQEVIDEGDNLQ